jgi:hypothetical protein
MSFKLTGTIKFIGETTQVSEKFTKREFVVTDTTSMYPQDIQFQITQDKCGLLDSLKIGQTVDVSFNIRGREWTSPQGEVKYFNTLEAWRVELGSASISDPYVKPDSDTPKPPPLSDEVDDDLPF